MRPGCATTPTGSGRSRLLDFLRDTGKHFTLSYMLQKESVKSRMETGISFTEFSYMLVQAYDFWHLYRRRGLRAADGRQRPVGEHHGRDGADRPAGGEERACSGLSAHHHRVGRQVRQERGRECLARPARRPVPYKFYQFWLNTDDRDVERCLKFFTFLPLEDIAAILAEQQRIRAARRPARLAEDVTTRVHGAKRPAG